MQLSVGNISVGCDYSRLVDARTCEKTDVVSLNSDDPCSQVVLKKITVCVHCVGCPPLSYHTHISVRVRVRVSKYNCHALHLWKLNWETFEMPTANPHASATQLRTPCKQLDTFWTLPWKCLFPTSCQQPYSTAILVLVWLMIKYVIYQAWPKLRWLVSQTQCTVCFTCSVFITTTEYKSSW